MVICLEQGADLHMAQLMPLPLTVCCFSEIQIGFTFLVPAHPGRPGKRAVKWVCVCVCAVAFLYRATVSSGDVLPSVGLLCIALSLPDASVDAVVSDIPFGAKHGTVHSVCQLLPQLVSCLHRYVCRRVCDVHE